MLLVKVEMLFTKEAGGNAFCFIPHLPGEGY